MTVPLRQKTRSVRDGSKESIRLLPRENHGSMPPRTRLRTAAGQATNSVSTPAIQPSLSKVVSPLKRSQSSQALSPEKSPSKKKSKTIVKQALVEPVPPPPRWREAYALIKEQRQTFIAPVDTMGCHKAGDVILAKNGTGDSISQEGVEKMKERSERDRRLACLVSLMLSSQTKDEVTAQATLNLRLELKNSLTVDSLREASLEEIESCINKVGFWKKKAQYIKLMADDLFIKHQSDVPKTLGKYYSILLVFLKDNYCLRTAFNHFYLFMITHELYKNRRIGCPER